MANEEHYRKLERMHAAAPINQWFRPQMRVGEGTAELTLTVRPEFFHAGGAVHGAVCFKMLDEACFFAVNSLVEDVFVLTVTFNIYFTRPVAAGTITAAGRVVFRSRRLFFAEAVLTDAAGQEIGRGSGSFVRSAMALTPDIGYA